MRVVRILSEERWVFSVLIIDIGCFLAPIYWAARVT